MVESNNIPEADPQELVETLEPAAILRLSCEFTFDEEGRPVVICPDAESQDRAVQAIRAFPDISVQVSSVRPVVEESELGITEPEP